MKGIAFGTGVAIVLRVVLTGSWPCCWRSTRQAVGGALILWIAVKLFMEADDGGAGRRRRAPCGRP